MEAQMPELNLKQLIQTVRETQSGYFKLTVIVGPSGAGKTRLLKQISQEFGVPVVNLNLLMSERLLSLTKKQRSLNAEEAATESIDSQGQTSLCIDNTELLFDSSLRMNPLKFLQDVSRNRHVIATWNGVINSGELRFAQPGHPDFFSQKVKGYPVVSLEEDKLQLHLTT